MKHFYGNKVGSNAAVLHRPGRVAVFGDPVVVTAGQGVGCWPRAGGGQGAAKHPATSTTASHGRGARSPDAPGAEAGKF